MERNEHRIVSKKNFLGQINETGPHYSFEFGDLKGSLGLSVKWLSPFGGISVSISTPLNSEAGDKTESFQFNLGTN